MLLSTLYTDHALPIPDDCPEIDCSVPDAAKEAFYYASGNGHLEIVKHLLTLPVVSDHIAEPGYISEAFQKACSSGQLEVVQHLTTFPFALDNKDNCDNAAFAATAYPGHLHVLEFLCTFPLVVETITEDFYQYIKEAVENNCLNIAKYLVTLLSKEDLFNSIDSSLLQYAVLNNYIEMVDFLLTLKPVLDQIAEGISEETSEDIKLADYELLGFENELHSVKINGALHLAIRQGHFRIAARLLKDSRVLSAEPLEPLFKCLIEKNPTKINGLFLESEKFWLAGLNSLKNESMTVQEKSILKISLQVALTRKLAELEIYPEDEGFIRKAKKFIPMMWKVSIPADILEDILKFTPPPINYFYPLPEKIPADLYPKILQFSGMSTSNIAMHCWATYYFDPKLNETPIRKAYQQAHALSASRIRRSTLGASSSQMPPIAFSAHFPLSSLTLGARGNTLNNPDISKATSTASTSHSAMEIEKPPLNSDLSKKRKQEDMVAEPSAAQPSDPSSSSSPKIQQRISDNTHSDVPEVRLEENPTKKARLKP